MNKNTILIILCYLSISCTRLRDGYTNKISYHPGDTMITYMSYNTTSDQLKTIKLYDMGGNVIDKIECKITEQKPDSLDPWMNGFGYQPTFQYVIPALQPGVYLWGKKIPFIIKSTTPQNITVVYPSNTTNAYCSSGGKSLYGFNSTDSKESKIVSFLRPMELDHATAEFFKWIYQEKEFSINYLCDFDLENYASISQTKLIIIIGHSEYWSRKARENFDRFVDNGGDAMVLSGNSMWWQVRYDTIKNQLICYRDTQEDPLSDSLLKTINWHAPSLNYPTEKSIGTHAEGFSYGDKKRSKLKIINEKSPLLEGTNLKNGDFLSLPTHEFDGAPVESFTLDSIPIIDNKKLNFYKVEPIAFGWGDYYNQKRATTFIIFQKTKTSGKIINVASTDWCSERGMGGKSGTEIKKITKNMIQKLIKKETVFTNTF